MRGRFRGEEWLSERRKPRSLLAAASLSLNLRFSSLIPLSLSSIHSTITFFQQVGFASLELGSVRAKNTRNILLKV